MTVIADSKRRVVMPGARPGDVFACADQGNGHFLLVRLNKPAPPFVTARRDSDGTVPPKMPLPDFFIGGQAEIMGWKIATHDQERFKKHLSKVALVTP